MKTEEIISGFGPISLEEMDSVKLMNRIDTKYVMSVPVLNDILQKISDNYFALEIDSQRVFPYKSLYYDTVNNYMYLAHHNGRLNRFKIRFRKYISSNNTFLEIKFKQKGIRTIKKRIEVDDIEPFLGKKTGSYIEKHTPFSVSELEPKIYTDFSRITLVNKDFSERVTIDQNLTFYFNGNTPFSLNNIIILELKSEGGASKSILVESLREKGVFPKGMSKYCLGRALSEGDIKNNNFKEKILTFNKIENGSFYFRNTACF
ncbi:MAG: polyphosphate polymerase domain-containing protein [Bacteroidales bacterium]|nr:polyphosphate polymerase domain-containing protein [Bacteroidales bacterium]